MLSYNSFSQTISIPSSSAREVKKGLLQGEMLKEENVHLKSIIQLQDGVIVKQDSIIFNNQLLLLSTGKRLEDTQVKLDKSRLHKVILGLGLALTTTLLFTL